MSEIDLLRYTFQFLKALIKKKYCPEGASRVGLCGRGGGANGCAPSYQYLLNSGGGGADASIGPRALETLTTPLCLRFWLPGMGPQCDGGHVDLSTYSIPVWVAALQGH